MTCVIRITEAQIAKNQTEKHFVILFDLNAILHLQTINKLFCL